MRYFTNGDRQPTVHDFLAAVASRASRNGISLPIVMDTKSGSMNVHDDEDLTSIYERVDMSYRKKHGQFFTPDDVAAFMVKFGMDKDTSTVMDPACGLGVFIKKALDIGNPDKVSVVGIDADPVMVNACHLEIKTKYPTVASVSLRHENYITEHDCGQKVDFLVCNPPYLNFHDFDRRLVELIEGESGVRFSKLVNLYALFMVKAKNSVRPGGKIAFITPSEFLYTGYGKTLKRFLLDNFTIDGMVTFRFDETVFGDILTTATITLLTNEKPRKDHEVKFVMSDGNLNHGENGARTRLVRQSSIDPDKKWQKYFLQPDSTPSLDKLVPLRMLAGVKRGIATGHNKFFLLSDMEAGRWGIEEGHLVPVLSKATQAPGYEMTDGMIKTMRADGQRMNLFCYSGEMSGNVKRYVDHGESEGVDARYLCAHRTPWYSMEKRKPAPILSTVFSRDNMRFIYNKAGCLNLAAFHGVYPTFEDEGMIKALLCYLNSDLCSAVQRYVRREYGNGLHKFEPGDLLELPVLPVTGLGRNDIKKLAATFDSMKRGLTKDPSLLLQEIVSTL